MCEQYVPFDDEMDPDFEHGSPDTEEML